MTTLMRLRRLTRQRVGVPMVDDFFTDDVIDDAINQAIETVEAEQRWPWQEHIETVTISPADPAIDLGPLWRATRAVFHNDRELPYVAPADLLAWAGPAATGQPEVWTVIGRQVPVAPLPASSIELIHYWYTQPELLQGDNSEPEIPGQFSGAIVAKAAELLAQRESDPGQAATFSADYNDWLFRMRRDLRRSTGPLRIRVRSGGWV